LADLKEDLIGAQCSTHFRGAEFVVVITDASGPRALHIVPLLSIEGRWEGGGVGGGG